MKRFAVALVVLAAACGSLPDAGGGVVALQLLPPDVLTLRVDSSVTLRARALDIRGDSVAAPIFWRTPDTAFVTLDSVSGVMVGKSIGSARVQARVGTLSSDILTFTIQPDSTPTTGIRRRP